MLRGEIIICTLSLISFFVFLIRIFPIWQDTGCFALHVIMMLIYEVQKSFFTMVTFSRFIEVLNVFDETILGMTKALFILIFFTTIILASAGQIGTTTITTSGSCIFYNSQSLAVTNVCLHLILELTILYVFFRHITQLTSILKSQSSLGTQLVTQIATILLCYSSWNVWVAAQNYIDTPDSWLMFGVYNLHFTVILLATGLPRRGSASAFGL